MKARIIIAALLCALMLTTQHAAGEEPPEEPAATTPKTTPEQTATPGRRLQQDSERKRNMSAADLQPSWNKLNRLSQKAGFTQLDQASGEARKNVFLRLRAAHADTEGPKTPLYDIPAESITILGERNGITYGTWKSGPAGTMRIRNYTAAHDDKSRTKISENFMALLRRSAKIWSKRLVDDGRRYDVTLEDGKVARKVHGIVIQTRLNNTGPYGGVMSARVHNYDDKDGYRPYNGRVKIPVRIHDWAANDGGIGDGHSWSVGHEIGHILGVLPWKDTKIFKKYYDHETHTWRGPNAMRANGGKPVPLQWVSKTNWSNWKVEPHAENARRDPTHIALDTSLLSYHRGRNDGGVPSEGDFAFLADIGFTVVDAKTAAETERYGHISWGEWAVWGASVGRDLKDNRYETPHDFVQAHATAFGVAPEATLANNPALTGTVVWNGSLVGVDLGKNRMPPVVGKAKLSVNLATLAGTAAFSDLTIHINGNDVFARAYTRPFRQSSLTYAVNITGNNFADGDERVDGSFYGPAHQEMAGTLKDIRPKVNLLAGFGGTRADD